MQRVQVQGNNCISDEGLPSRQNRQLWEKTQEQLELILDNSLPIRDAQKLQNKLKKTKDQKKRS